MADWNWGQAGSQAGQGAIGGASAGAAFGPWGAAIGGGIGGLAGLFGGGLAGDPSEEYKKRLQMMMDGYKNRQAPQLGAAHQAGQSQLVGNRAGLISQLEAMARGEGPSAARLQMREGMDRAVAAQTAMASGAGGRGVNMGAAMRNAGNQSAAIMSQGNRDMGVMRAQEQANAVGQLGQNISQGINADNGLSQFNTGQVNGNEMANAELQMRMLGLNDQSQFQALQMMMNNAQPSIGTSIMAGGASMAPLLAQMMNKPQQPSPQGGGVDPAYMQQLMQMFSQQQQYPSAMPGQLTPPQKPWGPQR